MANAARDPLWAACLTVALQDSIWALGNPNAGDLCIRCHTPTGWLAGHSDPPNLTALSGCDFEGVSCDYCHTSVDPMRGLRQTTDLPLSAVRLEGREQPEGQGPGAKGPGAGAGAKGPGAGTPSSGSRPAGRRTRRSRR